MPNSDGTLLGVIKYFFEKHTKELGYSLIAFLMALSRGVYNGDRVSRCLLDAFMCGLIAFSVRDELHWFGLAPRSAAAVSAFIGFVGVGVLSSLLEVFVKRFIRGERGNRKGDKDDV